MKRLFLLIIVAVFANTMFAKTQIGDLYYNLNDDDKIAEVAVNSSYTGTLSIPSTVEYNGTKYSVTSIGYRAFLSCSGLTSVTIPNSVTSIGNNAFSGCTSLTSVTIPNSVTSIGYFAFSGCSELTTVNFNAENCESCGRYYGPLSSSFIFPSTISTLNIGKNVKLIPAYAFEGCSGLTSVTIPNSVTSIGTSAFSGCSGLTSLTIGNSVTSIGEDAFYGCSGLTSVTIPNSVTSIGHYAFSRCSSLTSVTIPNSVTSIGDLAFLGCWELTTINFNAENCESCGSSKYPAFPSTISTLNIGNNVKRIPNSAFSGCSGLTSVTIPNSVTSVGYNAFSDCSGLIKSAYPDNLSNPFPSGISISYPTDNISFEDGIIFSSDRNELYFVPLNLIGQYNIPNSVTSIGSYAFYGCSGLSSVTIPNSITEIREYTFTDCSDLTSVTIPNSVTSIGNNAFSGCSGLTSVAFPNSVTSIGNSAFSGCSGLKEIAFYSNGLLNLGGSAFGDCDNIENIYCSTGRPPIGNDYSIFSTPVYSNAKLYVPSAQLNLYHNTLPWSQFYNIIGTDDFPNPDEVSVESIFNPEERVDVYHLNGTLLYKNVEPSQLNDIAPGLYIIGGKKVRVK